MVRRLISVALVGVLLLWMATIVAAVPLHQAEPAKKEQIEVAPAVDCKNLEIKPGKEKGKQERFFAFPMDKVKQALIDGMKAAEFEVKKEEGNKLEAHRKRHMGMFVGSGGEKLAISLEEAKEGEVTGTRIVVETKKGFVGRAGQKSWSAAVLNQTECILKGEK